tara:strand:+ start:412 stop:612 length:201 start_codon:yes stop_codon:yes gene_type:complete
MAKIEILISSNSSNFSIILINPIEEEIKRIIEFPIMKGKVKASELKIYFMYLDILLLPKIKDMILT